MRIALDGRTIQDHFPGIGRYAYNLALGLAEAAPGLEVALLHDPAQTNTRYSLAELAARGVWLVPVPVPAFALRQQWRVPRHLRALGASLYHAPYYVRPYRAGVPTVLTLHDVIPLRRPREYGPHTRLLFALAVRLAVASAARVITDSQAVAADLRQRLKLPEDKVVAVPMAADPAFVPQPAEAIAAVRARLDLPDTFALYVGSNKPHKNLPALVDAYASLPAAETPPLVIAGHWDERYPQARQRAQATGAGDHIRFLGPLAGADLPALYSAARMFIFPSLDEGFGLPVLEAMACGTPVVCSAIPPLIEVAGDAALCFDPAEPGALAAALSRALADDDLLRDLRQRGLERAASFSWKRTAIETVAVYESVKREA